jgi:hypothetical protein
LLYRLSYALDKRFPHARIKTKRRQEVTDAVVDPGFAFALPRLNHTTDHFPRTANYSKSGKMQTARIIELEQTVADSQPWQRYWQMPRLGFGKVFTTATVAIGPR